MEIRCVNEEKINNYPKINEISNKKIKKLIPTKWKKIGLTTLVLDLIANNKAFAFNVCMQLSGDVELIENVPVVQKSEIGKNVTSLSLVIGTFVIILGSIIKLILTKKKLMNDKDNDKLKKTLKYCEISITVFSIICIILLKVLLM